MKIIKCKECGKETKNKQFCSRSCAGFYRERNREFKQTACRKLTDEQEIELMRIYEKGKILIKDIAKKYNINRMTVRQIVKRRGGKVRKLRRKFDISLGLLEYSNCKRMLPTNDFHIDNSSKYKRNGKCIECILREKRDIWKEGKYRHRHALNARKLRKLNPISYLLSNIKSRAKKKGLDFDLNYEDIIIPKFCPVLGIKLSWGARRAKNNSPTIDRIDPSKGYTKDNIKIISWRANRLKSDATIDEVRKILKYYEREINKK